jgi:hypothetical protein
VFLFTKSYLFFNKNTNRESYMHLSSYEFPSGKGGNEGGQFIVGGYDHKFQTAEIEVFRVYNFFH